MLDQAKDPVDVWATIDADVASPRIELLLLSGGSRWDPPGQPGRAWVTAHALQADDGLWIGVGRDHAWLVVPCPTADGTAEACVAPLRRALAGPSDPQPARARARAALANAPAEVVVDEVMHGLMYEAHPYGHPISGRLGTLELSTGAGWDQPLWSRSTVRARVIAANMADAAALSDKVADVLMDLPASPPPDAAMKAPPPADGPTLARVTIPSGRAQMRLGLVMPRPATAPTRLVHTADEVQAWSNVQACLKPALDGWAWAPALEAPDGWPAEMTTSMHPAATWFAMGDASTLQDMLDRLPAQLADLPAAITPDCASQPDRTRALVSEALQSGYTVVVGVPDQTEDPWTPRVQGATMIDLPDRPEVLFR